MLSLFRLVAALELSLVMMGEALTTGHAYLPLGGTHLAQIGLLFGLTFALTEIRVYLKARKKTRPGGRSKRH